MKTQELKIEVPKGFEIDTEKSTFERIVFKEVNNNLEQVFKFNKTTEKEFNKKWDGFEDHEKFTALEKLIVNYYNKGEKPNWKDSSQYKYYPWFEMDGDNFRCYFLDHWFTYSTSSSRLCFLRKEDMLEAVELYLEIYKKSRL
jgi:hypothetical protein